MPASADTSPHLTEPAAQAAPNPLSSAVLMIFTRTLEAGKCKTRLIPTQGAAGALLIHRRLVEQALRIAGEFQQQSACTVQVHYAGSHPQDLAQPVEAAGLQAILQPQAAGDLGARLQAAFTQAAEQGHAPLLVIGSDCPELTATDLLEAWQILQTHDAVVGPALDGGYYLLGMRKPWLHLLTGIPWGTADVLAVTRTRLRESQLTWGELSPRGDVDLPSDLTPAVRSLLQLPG